MKVYLAGPMRGIPEFNHPAFHEGARRLRAAGHEVFNPAEHDNSVGLDVTGMTGQDAEYEAEGFSLRQLLGADLAWICAHAEAVVLLGGWERSPGARAEAAVGEALSLVVQEICAFLDCTARTLA